MTGTEGAEDWTAWIGIVEIVGSVVQRGEV